MCLFFFFQNCNVSCRIHIDPVQEEEQSCMHRDTENKTCKGYGTGRIVELITFIFIFKDI